jgi:hypothetical protein
MTESRFVFRVGGWAYFFSAIFHTGAISGQIRALCAPMDNPLVCRIGFGAVTAALWPIDLVLRKPPQRAEQPSRREVGA